MSRPGRNCIRRLPSLNTGNFGGRGDVDCFQPGEGWVGPAVMFRALAEGSGTSCASVGNLATLFATTLVDPNAKNSSRPRAGARDPGRPGGVAARLPAYGAESPCPHPASVERLRGRAAPSGDRQDRQEGAQLAQGAPSAGPGASLTAPRQELPTAVVTIGGPFHECRLLEDRDGLVCLRPHPRPKLTFVGGHESAPPPRTVSMVAQSRWTAGSVDRCTVQDGPMGA